MIRTFVLTIWEMHPCDIVKIGKRTILYCKKWLCQVALLLWLPLLWMGQQNVAAYPCKDTALNACANFSEMGLDLLKV